MSIQFVEQIFRQSGLTYLKRSASSINAEFPGYEGSLGIEFTEIQYNIVRAQIWFPQLDRSVRNVTGLCSFVNELGAGYLLEFDPKNNRLGANAHLQDSTDAYTMSVEVFVTGCEFALWPLSLEVSSRGCWTEELVRGYLAIYPKPNGYLN
jgi:hypothetical protein